MTPDWQIALRRLKESPTVCLDVETSGLDWRKHHVVGWVLAFGPAPSDSYYLPVRHASGGNILGYRGPQVADSWDEKLHPIEGDIIRELNTPGKHVFGHHLAFDLRFTWRLGLQTHDMWLEDTMVNEALLDEHTKYSLEMCCQRAGVAAKLKNEIAAHILAVLGDRAPAKDPMSCYWLLHGEDPVGTAYAKGDGTSTWQLRDVQWPKLAAEGLTRVWDIECRLISILARMTCRGIRVDEERIRQILHDIDSGRIERSVGLPTDFNVKAPTQVLKYLTDRGISNWGATKTGKPQLNEAFLSTFPEGQAIVAIRQGRTLRDSFMRPLLDRHIWRGRVHPHYHQSKMDDYGVMTGRLACTEPGMQQASKRNQHIGRLHRSVFRADEGMIWGSADYRQCEPVLLAHYSRAKVLIDGFNSYPPVDAHSAVTRAMNRRWAKMADEEFEDVKKTPEYKQARETGKRVNQTLLTGGGKGVLTTKYGIPPREVEIIWNDYFRILPEVRELQQKSKYRMAQRGYVMSLLGRRARLKDWDLGERRKAYTSVNRLLQCGNADIIKYTMVKIDDYLKSEGRPIDMINTVHDSLDFQFHPENRHHYEECLRIMEDFPTDDIPLTVPLRVDYGEGPDWAIATFGEPK